jgi:surface carbohydrate biosynthesis protein
MNFFLKYLRFFFNTKKIWGRPNKSKVLIYDGSGVDVLSKYFKKWNPEILYVRGESINLQILFFSLLNGGKFYDSYVDEYINFVSPDLIVTYTDNNLKFFSISQRHKTIKTLFIQNGMRYYYGDIFYNLNSCDSNDLKNLTVDYMMTFGKSTKDYYHKYISGSIVPMGSIKNNLVPKQSNFEGGLLTYLSQYKAGRTIDGEYYDYEKYAGQTVKTIIYFLRDYAESNKKKLMIIPRHSKKSDLRKEENDYYSKLLGYGVEFLDFDKDYSSYHAADLSEVMVSVDSTLAIESIARGNKVAIFSVRGDILGLKGFDYGWPANYPNDGPFWTNHCNLELFDKILNYLFSVDEVQWHNDLEKTNFSLIMEYYKGNSILIETVNKILEKPQDN